MSVAAGAAESWAADHRLPGVTSAAPPPPARTQPRHADTYTYNASLCIFMLEVAYK